MSDAIRDVTIRVRIEQIEAQLRAPNFAPIEAAMMEHAAKAKDIGQQIAASMVSPQTFAQQVAGFNSIANAVSNVDNATKAAAATDPFANIDASVQKLNGSLQQEAASLDVVENAARRNFDALIGQAQAEASLEQSIQRANAARQTANVENITGAGNALRAAAASGTFSGVITGLGQALIFTAKGAYQQAAGNAAVATSATAAGLASEFQARAIGHVSAAGARAATTNAALAASNAAASASAAGAAGMMGRLAGIVPQIAIGVAAVSIAVEVGSQLWAAYGRAGRTANDDIRDAVKQRIEAEKQSAQIEFQLSEEQRRRTGLITETINKQTEATMRYRDVQKQVMEAQRNSFEGQVSRQAGDPATQLAMLRNQDLTNRDNAIRDAARGRFFQANIGNGQINDQDLIKQVESARATKFKDLGGTDLVRAEEERLRFIQVASDKLRERLGTEGKIKDIMQQQLQVDLQSRDAAKSRLATIQDQIAAEQGRLQSAAERFAQMDPGEQARLKEVAIKAKGGGELTLQEAQLLSQSGVGQGQASQAFQRIANKAGFQDVAGNLGEFDQIKQLQFQGKGAAESVRAIEETIRSRMEEIVKAGSSIESLSKAFDSWVQGLIALGSRVDALQAQFADSKAKGQASSGAGIHGGRAIGY
ncbi:MAG: hypothetical protein JSS49_30100 [Planctomycetes bacterium]|nr:hypothetical protein [Planctomycetota bacterium]